MWASTRLIGPGFRRAAISPTSGGEPVFRGGEILRGELVAGGYEIDRGISAASAEEVGDAGRMIERNKRVDAAVEEQRAFARERAGGGGLIEHDHAAQQDGLSEEFRPQEHERDGDIGSVGKAHRREARQSERVAFFSGYEKIGEGVGALDDLGGIENALGNAGKEARGAVFADISSGAQQSGTRGDRATEAEKIVFGAAGPVEQQQGRRGRIGARLENMLVGK